MNLIHIETNTRHSLPSANRRLRKQHGFHPLTERTVDEAAKYWGYTWEQPTESPAYNYLLDQPQADAEGVYHEAWVQRPALTSDEIEAYKISAIQQINTHYDNLVNGLAEHYPQFERDSWPDQRREAEAYTAWVSSGSDPETLPDTTVLDGIVSGTGDDLLTYCGYVLAKVEAYKQLGGKYVGLRIAARNQISDAATKADIDAILESLQ
jgi:hypothetical protein